MRAIHPGEFLHEEILAREQIGLREAASLLQTSPRRLDDLVHGRFPIGTRWAKRLARATGTTAEFWLKLQEENLRHPPQYALG